LLNLLAQFQDLFGHVLGDHDHSVTIGHDQIARTHQDSPALDRHAVRHRAEPADRRVGGYGPGVDRHAVLALDLLHISHGAVKYCAGQTTHVRTGRHQPTPDGDVTDLANADHHDAARGGRVDRLY